jgi:hypothetical protein
MDIAIKFIAAIAFVFFLIYSQIESQKRDESKQNYLQQFTTSLPKYLSKDKVTDQKLPIGKKFIIIDAKTSSIVPHEDYAIDSAYRPLNAEDVNTAIVQDCEYVEVGAYTNGAKALQEECNVQVVDVDTHTWSDWGTIKGGAPSNEISRKRGSTSDEKGPRAMSEFLRANLR